MQGFRSTEKALRIVMLRRVATYRIKLSNAFREVLEEVVLIHEEPGAIWRFDQGTKNQAAQFNPFHIGLSRLNSNLI